MNSKDYVLNHDFGYGKRLETKTINKLELRNIQDLIEYVNDFLDTQFITEDSKIDEQDCIKTQIIIKKVQ